MPASIAALLAVACGYVTIQLIPPLQYRSRFQEWDRIALESAIAGWLLLVLFRVWILPWAVYLGCAGDLRSWTAGALPIPYGGTVLGAGVLGVSLGGVINLGIRALGLHDNSVRWAIRQYGGELFSLITFAFERDRLLSITLRGGKVYVGYVARTPSITKERMLVIVPVLSGYRDRETQQMWFTTDYSETYEAIDDRSAAESPLMLSERDFEIVLPMNEVTTANLFHIGLYERFFASRQDEVGRQSVHSH